MDNKEFKRGTWTKDELKKLEALAKATPRISISDISDELKRSMPSCKAKIVEMCYRAKNPLAEKAKSMIPPRNVYRMWTKDELALLEEMISRVPRPSLETISIALNKPKRTCYCKIYGMRQNIRISSDKNMVHANGKKVWYG